ncbi:MAG TPA: CorA family divalent cation transporter [Burkholderiales bacterium]|nr:CorA family divalent cation transporter [Burkholderiales bacterium]
MLRVLARCLNEPVMGFLALAALSGGIAPMLFAMPAWLEQSIALGEWAIIGLFALEYLVHLALADDKGAYMRNPWRIVDALIVIAPLVSLLPWAPNFLRSSPALRVLRLARVLLFGARARHGLVAGADMGIGQKRPAGPVRVASLSVNDTEPQRADWRALLDWVRKPDERWMHAANLDEARIKEIAPDVELPDVMIDAALRESSYPRLEARARWCAFAVSLPGGKKMPRTPVLLLVCERHLLSFSLHDVDIQSRPAYADVPWGTRCALHVVRAVLDRNEQHAAEVERELRELEHLDPNHSPEDFFEDVFRLKRQLTLAKGDLWRLKNLLAMLAEGRREMPGLGGDNACLKQLSEQADYLHETVEKAHEQLLTLLDLHLNIASYDVNRFMRLLAVVSSLAIIPTIVGGLLGMNVAGNPWPVTLSQIAFGTFILMLCVLYAFLAKGWLRS